MQRAVEDDEAWSMKETMASYLPERMIIRIGPELKLVDDQGKPMALPTADAAAVFFHEYAHFLHNISIVSGIAVFVNTVELWRRFRITHGTSGFCSASGGQSAGNQDSLEQLLKHLHEMRRDNSPKLKFVINPVAINIHSHVLQRTVRSNGDVLATAVRYEAEVKDNHGGTELVKAAIGTLELLECAAWLLEKRIVKAVDPSKNAERPRLFPYLVVEVFCKYEVPELDEDGVLSCVLGALQSSDATFALTELLAICPQATADGRSAVDVIRSCTKSALAESLPKMEKQFVTLEEECSGDGIMGAAIRRIVEVARAALALRAESPFFELDWVQEIAMDNMHLNDVMERIPSCAVLQVNGGSEDQLQRDFLLSFLVPDTDSSRGPEEGFRVVHSIFDYLGRHADLKGFVPTNRIAYKPCPFYTSCDLPLRRASSGTCKNTPWESADWPSWGEGGVCWYGVGIRVTRQPPGLDRNMRGVRSKR